MALKHANDENFAGMIGNGITLVDFWAVWCGPCRMLSPIIDELASEITDYKFYKLDVDNSTEVTKKYGIMSIPTLLIFEDGNLKEKVVGFISKDELTDKLK